MAAKRKDEDRRPSNLLLEGWKAEFCNYLETVATSTPLPSDSSFDIYQRHDRLSTSFVEIGYNSLNLS